MGEKFYFTADGLAKATEELKYLKSVGRSEIAAEIEEAREKGDLKENAEYKAAKEKQSLHELKISKLENTVVKAVVIDESNVDISKTYILSTVKIKNLKNNMVLKYTLMPASGANLKESKISVDSPVGKGLLGKKVGDIAEIKVPAGVMEFEILEITRGEHN